MIQYLNVFFYDIYPYLTMPHVSHCCRTGR